MRSLLFSGILALLSTSAVAEYSNVPDPRFDRIVATSDMLICDYHQCTKFKTGESFDRESDYPVGYMILIEDESFSAVEIEIYKDRLLEYWSTILK